MTEDPAERPVSTPAARRTAARGLAARPGQRRAVRLIAVLLGMLAVALGVRDALLDDPPSPADVRPARSAERDPGPPR